MRHRKNIAKILVEQIQALVGHSGVITLKREKPWASITFSGTRHYIEISCPQTGLCSALKAQLDRLPDTEFDLPGHFVADLIVQNHRLGDPDITIEILTIIDPVIPDSRS